MNLFFNPSLHELHQLISEGDQTKPVHNIVVDYDGEVLIDPDEKQPELNLDRFKFRIKLYEMPKDYINRGSRWMKKLLHRLMDGWEDNFPGINSGMATN
jgi:hypothetical protein